MLRALRSWKVLVGLAVLVGVGAWLAFGLFEVQTLFIDDKVDEAAPRFTPAAPAPAAVVTPAPQPTPSLTGTFVSRSHPTKGTAVVLSDGADRRVLRLDQLSTENGPDLNVYLSAAPADAPAGRFDDDFVDLGDLKGNIGSQNYELPAGVDLARYRTVVIWCVRFHVAFGSAPLA